MRHTRDRGCGGTHFDLCGCMKFLLPFPFSSPPPLSLPLDAVSLFPRCLPLPLFISPFAAPFLLCVCTSLYTRSFCNASLGCVCVWCGEDVRRGNGKRCVFFDFYRALAVCASHLREYSLNNFKDLEPLFLFLFCFQESRRDKRRDVCARRRGRDGGPSSIYPSVDFLSLISVYLVSYFLF